jgi:pimeloyl-ACP methyl ester carboxylesterase
VKRSLIGGAVGLAAAAAGAALFADRKVSHERKRAQLGQDDFAEPRPERAAYLRASDGVRLYVEQDGPLDAPVTVVLIHGFCLNRDELLFQRRAIRERFGDRVRVVSPDLRSHGRSGRSDSEHATIDQLGADLLLLLDELVPQGQVVLIGHSMGGMTIMALADARPELFAADGRIAAVGLLSTSTGKLATVTFGLPAALSYVGAPVTRMVLRGASREAPIVERGRARITDVAWVFVKRVAFGPDVDPALVEFMTRMIGATPVDVISDFFPALMAHDKLKALDALVDTRVVIICGDSDLITPPDHSRAIADALPKADLVIVPDAGHQAMMERPDLVNPPLLQLVQDTLDHAVLDPA